MFNQVEDVWHRLWASKFRPWRIPAVQTIAGAALVLVVVSLFQATDAPTVSTTHDQSSAPESTLSSLSPTRERVTPTSSSTPVLVAPLQVSTPRVPSWPVEALQRIDLSVEVTNPDTGSIADITVRLTVYGPDGRVALDVRQGNLRLQPKVQQLVQWQWRIPDHLAAGRYTVAAQVLDSDGRVLSGATESRATLQIAPSSGFVHDPIQETSPIDASPYICGANMTSELANKLDVVKQMGVTTIRLAPDSNFSAFLRAINNAGLQPMIILHGAAVTDPAQRLALNVALVKEAQQLFGVSTRLFYEVGNENDLESGLSADDYAAMWNAMVPRLKEIAPESWFGGPVNYQANALYTASFLHAATPRPDFISWHEYTCPSQSTGDNCLRQIASWPKHIVSIREAIQGNNDIVPPMMVTEWNYAPDSGVIGDDKHNDPAFLRQWTTTALQSLIDNQVYGSYQFNVYGALPLLDNPQGIAIQQVCQPIVLGHEGPVARVAATSVATDTPSAASTVATAAPPTATPVAVATPVIGAGVNAPASGALVAEDRFNRPDQTYWSSSSSGSKWIGDANAVGVFAIRDHTGIIAGGNRAYDAVMSARIADGEVRFTGSMSAFVSSNIGAVLRWNDANNWYKAYIDGANLIVQKRFEGSYTVLGAAPFSATTNTRYTLSFQAVGTRLSAKVWSSDGPEPKDPMVTANDGTLVAGEYGLRAQVLGDAQASYTSFVAYDLSGSTPTPAPTGTVEAVGTTVTPVSSAEAVTHAIVAVSALNVHRGPGTGYPVFASITLGERYQVVGQSAPPMWLKLCCVRGQSGWVQASLVTLVTAGSQNQ